MVTDKGNGLPLPGALILLKIANTADTIATTTDTLGRYRLENIPIGRQGLQVQYLGYEKAAFIGLLIEAGKEVILNIQLEEKPAALSEIVVTATPENHILHPLSIYTLKVEEQFRYPTTYFDPARLAMSLPGVAGVDDQGNSISVRGNSPASTRWRLEGVDIVNPNHTANAGTFSDRPTAAGGGVNILSAQLLGTSNFLSGAYPAGYGNALGGLFDMHFRKGNDERHEFTAQAGVIGIEAAAEGPLDSRQSAVSSSQSTTGISRNPSLGQNHSTQVLAGSVSPFGEPVKAKGSYLVNYRYSFVGILTAAGADFGGEEINFQDLSFHLNFPVLKNAELGFFGVGGLSENIFKSPLEADTIKEEKDLFNIDFKSKMGATGLTFKSSLNKKIKLNTAIAYSGLEHERYSEKVVNVIAPVRWSEDRIKESKFAFFAKLFFKNNAQQNWDMGLQVTREHSSIRTFFTDNFISEDFGEKITGWLLQPFINGHIYLSSKIKMDIGLHGHYFTESSNNTAVLPRAAFTYFTNKKQQIILAFGWYAQTQPTQVYLARLLPKDGIGPTKSLQVTAAFQHKFDSGHLFKTEIYHQSLNDVPVSARAGSNFSILNNIENFRPTQDTLTDTGKGRNYGLDIFLESPLFEHSFARLGASLYRSLYTDNDRAERPTRFDGRYLINASSGREKVKKKKNKTIIRGYSTRLSWYGGFRQTPIDEAASAAFGYTIFDETKTNKIKLKDYFRVDFRFYWKWNKPNRSTTFSIDLQNAGNRKNEAYIYYDQVQQRVLTKKQLGLIPLVAYRVEF